jgi:transcriptional regulator GlxA family with amidase domain
MPPALHTVAVVAYEGVLADETAAFVDVLSRLPAARVVKVGAAPGVVGGPGGAQEIEARFEEVDPDVVVVPGGLGSHRHPEIARWIRRTMPTWVLSSSTGSALLAAGGLLEGRRAATHWLAGPLLERFGVIVSSERLVVDGHFVTCAGLVSTFDAADVVVRSVGGDQLVRRIHADMEHAALHERPVCPPTRTRYRVRGRRAAAQRVEAPTRSPWAPPVDIELEDVAEDLAPARRRR